MRVCVTGGAGFIGSHLVDQLVLRGDEVVVLDDFSTGRHENLNSNAMLIEGSITDAAAVQDAVAGCDLVYHLASRVSVEESLAKPDLYHAITALGTKTVAELAPCRVVLASSCAVYGDQTVPIEEDAPCAPRSPYAQAKLDAEAFVDVSLRFFNVYGPRQRDDSPYSGVIAKFLATLDHSPPTIFGDGLQTRDFVYVSDVVNALLLAGDVESGIFNIGTGIETNLIELAGVLGCEEPQFESARDGEVRRSCANTERARRVLGFEASVQLDGLT